MSALTKSNQRLYSEAAKARAAGNDGYYARSVSAMHRAAGERQQAALDAAIMADNTGHLFGRTNGALVAKEG